MAIQRRAIIYHVPTVIVTAAVRAWHTTPIEIAPAPGANRVIEPLRLQLQYKAGTAAFGVTDVDNLYFSWGTYLDATHATGSSRPFRSDLQGVLTQTTDRIEHGLATDLVTIVSTLTTGFATADVVNKPLMLLGDNDLQGGGVATATLNAAGLLYAANDTGHIITGGNTSATYRVLTVGAGGAVATFSITAAGNNYAVATGLDTDTSGSGSGFKVNVTGITKGNGSLITTVFYGVVQLQ